MKNVFARSAHPVSMNASCDRIIERTHRMIFLGLLFTALDAGAQSDSAQLIYWTEEDKSISMGDVDHFLWGGSWLHLNAPMAGSSTIARRASLGEVWEVGGTMILDFNPSSSNYIVVQGTSEGTGSTWELSVGQEEDGLTLYRIQSSEKTLLCRSASGLLDRAETVLHWELKHGTDRRYSLRWWVDDGLSGEVHSIPDSLGSPVRGLQWAFHYTATRTTKMHLGPIWWHAEPEGAVPLPAWQWTEIYANATPLIPGLSPPEPFLEGVLMGPTPMRWDGWELYVNQRRWPIPSAWIFPGLPVVIGGTELGPWISSGVQWIPIDLDLPNDARIVLKNHRGETISAFSYQASWHRPPEKALVGYSLEPPCPSQSCLPAVWSSSIDLRGTSLGDLPHGPPSPYASGPPELWVEGMPGGPRSLMVHWRHPIDPTSLPPQSGGTWTHLEDGKSRWTPQTFPEDGGMHEIVLPPDACDCTGAPLDIALLRWGWPRSPEPFELTLTEYLEDPLPYEPRFVEVHNHSLEVLDVGGLFLSDATSGGLWRRVGEVGTFIRPGETLAWSEDPHQTKGRYSSGDSTQVRQAFANLFPMVEPFFLGLFRSDGLLLDALEERPDAWASSAEGLSWTRTLSNSWVPSGDSASPGRWQVDQAQAVDVGRVILNQRSWTLVDRPSLAYHFLEEGAWRIRERWLAIRGGWFGPWQDGPMVEHSGTWTCALPAPPGHDWLWEVEWTSPNGRVRRRAFVIRLRE